MNPEKSKPFDVSFTEKNTNKINELKERHHILTLLKEWQQLVRIYVKPGDSGVVISNPNIGKVMAYEVLDMLGLSQNINAEEIRFELVFSYKAIPDFLDAIYGSKFENVLFNETDKLVWDKKSGDLHFYIEDGVAINFNLKYYDSKRTFHLDISYPMVTSILRQVPDSFPVLIRMASLKKNVSS